MILLTGATGYVGGRLLKRLEEDKLAVRCLCRDPAKLRLRENSSTTAFRGDLNDPASVRDALAGVDTAYYLVHSMYAGKEFERQEQEMAANFAEAADEAGIKRIIYLGGLAQGDDLSPHMRSRIATGKILRKGLVPVTEFQASIVIGPGSASFEMIRALVERLPVMITPRWVRTPAQPIGIDDVIEYLHAALPNGGEGHKIVEIGGADVTSYLGIMKEFARQRGLRRLFIPVPVLSLSLSSRWLTLITPVYASIGRSLIESVRHPSIVQNPDPARDFGVTPAGLTEAIQRALTHPDPSSSRWCDARLPGGEPAPKPSPTCLTNMRSLRLPAGPERAFKPIRRIGGKTGWYFGTVLWRARGVIDLLLGGVGMRRGRSDPEHPSLGGTLDFWRVVEYERDRRLRLIAEMKVPGRAWLEFTAEPDGEGTVLTQKAMFDPSGFAGLLYWYLLWPVHELIFRGMLRGIGRAATAEVNQGEPHNEVAELPPPA